MQVYSTCKIMMYAVVALLFVIPKNLLSAEVSRYSQFQSDRLPVYEELLSVYRNAPNNVEGYYQALGVFDKYSLNNRDEFLQEVILDMAKYQGNSYTLQNIKKYLLEILEQLKSTWPMHKYKQKEIRDHHRIFEKVRNLLEKDFEKLENQAQSNLEKLRYLIKARPLKEEFHQQFLEVTTLPTLEGEESIDSFYGLIGMDRNSVVNEFFNTATEKTLQALYALEKKFLKQVKNNVIEHEEKFEEFYRDVANKDELQEGKKRFQRIYRDIINDIRYISNQSADMHNKWTLKIKNLGNISPTDVRKAWMTELEKEVGGLS